MTGDGVKPLKSDKGEMELELKIENWNGIVNWSNHFLNTWLIVVIHSRYKPSFYLERIITSRWYEMTGHFSTHK